MINEFSRLELLIGSEGLEKLKNARVAVFGVGGVGSYAAEALARSGIGAIDLIDDDEVSVSNIPECAVRTYRTFYTPETAGEFDFAQYDYVIDAIDTVSGKIAIAVQGEESGTPVISAMGAGNKLDPTAFEVTDIYKTSVCPLARVMRRELKKRGVKRLKVVYSREEAMTPLTDADEENTAHKKRQTPGSAAFVPSVAGLILAGEVVKDIIS